LVTYYVLFFIHIASRKVHIAGMTTNPNESWMKQIARNLIMSGVGFLDGMKYLVLDRDAKFAESFRSILESAGTEPAKRDKHHPQPQHAFLRFAEQGFLPPFRLDPGPPCQPC
jgi:putative transposase